MTGETTRKPMSTFHRSRTEAELRAVLSMLCNYIWTKRMRASEHMWSIPVDVERDFDCILSDGITELTALRAKVERLRKVIDAVAEASLATVEPLPDGLQSALEQLHLARGLTPPESR